MTLAQINDVSQRMQQQWHDLVIAEEAGRPEAILEQMYNVYILLAEEFNACTDEYQRQRQSRCENGAAWRANIFITPTLSCQEQQKTSMAIQQLLCTLPGA